MPIPSRRGPRRPVGKPGRTFVRTQKSKARAEGDRPRAHSRELSDSDKKPRRVSKKIVGEHRVSKKIVGEHRVSKKIVGEHSVSKKTVGEHSVSKKTVGEHSVRIKRKPESSRTLSRKPRLARKTLPSRPAKEVPIKLKLARKPTGQTPSEVPKTASVSESANGVRLNKFISNAGITSRRKADELITSGAVNVNGKVVTELGVRVRPYDDHVTVNGETISLRPRFLYLLLNKPKDTITTTSDEKDRSTVLDYINAHERVYPVGRLDRNTTGVLLLTNDGELTNRLTHPRFEIEREYHVTLDKAVTKDDAKKIAEGGIDIGDGDLTGPAEVSFLESGEDVFLKIKEGKNREVRRLFETLGYEVEKLDRVSFAGITHRGMARGESRPLTPQEIHRLKHLAGIES